MQKVNGYVRLGEMTQLWMVIFADRRLSDIVNLLFAPAIAASTYVMARRYTSRVLAIGWGIATILVPACANYLQSTYVDTQNCALVLGAVVFSTLERPRLRDGLLGALGLALAIASKGLALSPCPSSASSARSCCCASTGALGAQWRSPWWWAARFSSWPRPPRPTCGTTSPSTIRSARMRVEIPALGIHWPGMGPWAGSGPTPTTVSAGLPVNLNEPLPKLLDHLFALPFSVKGMFFDQAVEYGIGVIWVALPIGAIAFLATLVLMLRRRLGHLAADEPTPPFAIALVLAAMIAGSPAIWGARYHVSAVALLFVLVAWLTRRPAWQRLEEFAVSAVLITSLMMIWWQPEPRYWAAPSRLVALAHRPPLERELDRDLGAPTELSVGLARENELTAGKLLVFDEHYAGFPSLFWNNTYSNRVRYLPGGPSFLARAAQAGATWILLTPGDSQMSAARAPGSGWQEVGQLNPIARVAFRRVAVPLPVAPPVPAPPPVAAPIPPPPPVVKPPVVKPPAKVRRRHRR